MEAHKPSAARDYFIAFFIALILFVVLGCYLFLRRGFMFDGPATADILYVPNKLIASVGAVMIGLSFLVGPVVRYFDRFDQWVGYRKEIGIVGGMLAITHGLLTYFFLPKKFPMGSLLSSDYAAPMYAGIFGAVILAALITLSLQYLIVKVGGGRWWFLQRWGIRVAVALTLFHIIVMKWDGWERWYALGLPATTELQNPWMTPLNLLVTLFLLWVTLLRLYETVFLFKESGWSRTKEIVMDPVIKQRGRQFFLWSLMGLVLLVVAVLLRWIAL